MFPQYGSRLYWTDWTTQSIESVDKMTGMGQRTVQRHMVEGLMGISMVSTNRQLGKKETMVKSHPMINLG